MSRSQKKFVFGLLLATFVLVSVFLYANLDSGAVASDAHNREMQLQALALRHKVNDMEHELQRNKDEISRLKTALNDELQRIEENKKMVKDNMVYDEKAEAEAVQEKNIAQLKGESDHKAVEEEQEDDLRPGGGQNNNENVVLVPPRGNKVAVVHEALKKTTSSMGIDICSLSVNFSHTDSDVQMLDVYKLLKFDNPDGGVWKQGWEVTYDTNAVSTERPLKVIVIPHSHCDPGWIKTFEKYYEDQTSKILNGMAKNLNEKPDMRFIYAEMSFFEKWWTSQGEAVRADVKRYLNSGQFEIVTGGWVMTDEANAHYFSIITELFEGHEFLKNNLDYTPTSHWSIDPFGLSPSIPFLLSAANITNAALQRVHYSIKKHLAKNKQLEFHWRQLWGANGQKDVRTHVFPFYSYDVPHTCGPQPSICCQFDFLRMSGGSHSCPWGFQPQSITDSNVEERAFAIYDQYRKKSQLYGTNVLLIPLGDDFRYDSDFEWNAQYDNYQKLFNYMNSKKEWNVQAKFGVLSDYFNELGKELEETNQKLPILSGDFFTYADRDDHYWSGYFTSRPFYKHLDGILQHYVRSAELAFSLASMNGFRDDSIFTSLVMARRALSLFQHHDGITGTAKDHVMLDYGSKMVGALKNCERVLSSSIKVLANSDSTSILVNHQQFSNNDVLPDIVSFKEGQFVVIFNSLGYVRSDVQCIMVDSADLSLENVVAQQISPVFSFSEDKLVMDEMRYELCFQIDLKPLSVKSFKIVRTKASNLATVRYSKTKYESQFFDVKQEPSDFVLTNDVFEATFDHSSGFLKAIKQQNSDVVSITSDFVQYGARPHKRLANGGGDDLSGAYLFLPDGPAKSLELSDLDVQVVEGPLVNRVYIAGAPDLKLMQKFTMWKQQPRIDIETEVDISQHKNFELAVRLTSNIKNEGNIYTDLNGLQFIRHVRMLDKLPLQAHYYPSASGAYIEDRENRLHLLAAQPSGVASLSDGEIEFMLDRRLNQDDGRGLFQGVLDNKRTLSLYSIVLEPLTGADPSGDASRVGFPTKAAFESSNLLRYPWIRMLTSEGLSEVSGIPDNLPCDIHLVSLRTTALNSSSTSTFTARKSSALILFRPMLDCRGKLLHSSKCLAGDSVSIPTLFPTATASESSLTLLYEGAITKTIKINPQEVRTVKLSW